jgi:hypothetical protein
VAHQLLLRRDRVVHHGQADQGEARHAGGAEDGVAVGFVNYPRFPKKPHEIESRAMDVAENLMKDLFQWTALVVTPAFTYWFSRRPQDQE